jgi:predicted O-linked N-acetylglucosamine transferase (SPINDLY family)
VSAFFRGHTVGRLFSAWAGGLAARGVEVHVWHTGSGRDAESEELSAKVHRFYHLSGRAEGLVTAVRAARLHGVIFPELGMDLATFHAASAKLAPVQAMAWGHPVSSGLPSMDLFLSSTVMEPEQGAHHYRETLVPLPGLSIQYRRPPRVAPRPRAELGVPEGVPLLVCVQSLFKILPRHDAMFAGLLARSPRAHLVMLAHIAEPVTRTFRERLSACLLAHGVDPAGRLHFLPQMNREHFLGLLAAADLYIDGPGWSGGNTTLEAVSQGCAILCRWGQTMRERHTAGILQQMGLSELIATDEEDWIERGVRWAEDPDARAASSAAVRAGAEGLFGDSRPLDALAGLVHGWQTGKVFTG